MARRPSGLNDRKSLKRFRRYALVAGGAAVGGVVAPNTADASIVFYDPIDVTVGVGDRARFDIYTGDVVFIPSGKKSFSKSTSVFEIRSSKGNQSISQISKAVTKKGIRGIAGSYAGVYLEVGRYQSGDLISSQRDFERNGYLDNDPLNVGLWGGGGPVTGFVGLSFGNPNLSGNLFGWARITVDDANDTVILHEFAYENVAGVGIVIRDTGSVPEPSSLAMWAAGAMGVVALRRRRKKKVAEQAG